MLRYHVRRPAVHHADPDGARLARLAFLVNVGDGAFWTIIPIQLAELFSGDGPVGFYLAVVALVGAVATTLSGRVFQRYSKISVGVAALIVTIVLLFAMSLTRVAALFAMFDVIRSVGFVILTVVLGLLVRDHATLANLAIEEGRHYLYSNLGWLVGPVSAGYLASISGGESVFAAIAAVYVLALLYLVRLHVSEHPALQAPSSPETATHALRSVWEFVGSRRLRDVFALEFGLELWWVVTSIYIPLAVIEFGFGTEVVGWVIAGGVVPLVLLEVWVGKQAQRRGTRPYLITGFMILSVGALGFIAFGFSPETVLVLFAAVNIGGALIEPLTTTYFFQVTSEEEGERLFGVFNAAAPLAALIGPLFAAVVFSSGAGLSGVWVLAAIAMAWATIVALRLPQVG